MRYFLTLGPSRGRLRFLLTAALSVLAFLAATEPYALAQPCTNVQAMTGNDRVGKTLKKFPEARLLQPLAMQAVTQPRQVPFSLNASKSHIDWLFNRTGWWVAYGSASHAGDDCYAYDWNLGSYGADKGHIVLSAFPGFVIYAGNNGGGYGNQVIVQSFDDPTFAIRYAHLHTIAQNMGDLVYFGSEIGTVGKSGGNYSPHLHAVLYKNIDQPALDRLHLGATPSGVLSGGPTKYAASFENDGNPVDGQCSEDLPCWTWNGDVAACDAHSIPFGGKYTQDCAYYFCSGLCLPRGTANCRAGCPDTEGPNPVDCDLGDVNPDGSDDDSDDSVPCHTWDGDLQACDDHSILFGDEYTRDCAYYIGSGKCRPRGTSNCLAGIYGDCGVYGCFE